MDTIAVLKDEAEFADACYAPFAENLSLSQQMFQKYARPRNLWDWREFGASLLGDVAGKKLLDLGCGMGEESVYFAKLGANVTAIDISELGIAITRRRAAVNEVADRINAHVMKATPTDFPSDSFEIVHGLGILHHTGLAAGLAEIRRVLKRGGTGLFLEPMGNCAMIEKAKRLIYRCLGGHFNLDDVTDYEENLKLIELRRFQSEFAHFQLYPYHLFHRVRKLFCPSSLHSHLKRFDYRLLRLAPVLRYFAGGVVIHLKK